MTKREFLKELEDRLQMLNEKERKDMIEEYSQHINMRMESGMSEEEAIDDFGNIDDLIAEIFEAYHLDPEYETRSKMTESGSAGAGISLNESLRIETEQNREDKEKSSRRAKRAGRFKAEPPRKVVGEFAHKTGKAGGDAVSWGWDKVKRICWLCIKVALLFLVLPAVFFDLAGMFGLGLLLVMAFQGYPVFGAAIIAVGCVLSMTAYIIFLFTYIFKRRGAKA